MKGHFGKVSVSWAGSANKPAESLPGHLVSTAGRREPAPLLSLQTDGLPRVLWNAFVPLFTQGPGSSKGSWTAKGRFSGFMPIATTRKRQRCLKCVRKIVRKAEKHIPLLLASTLQ